MSPIETNAAPQEEFKPRSFQTGGGWVTNQERERPGGKPSHSAQAEVDCFDVRFHRHRVWSVRAITTPKILCFGAGQFRASGRLERVPHSERISVDRTWAPAWKRKSCIPQSDSLLLKVAKELSWRQPVFLGPKSTVTHVDPNDRSAWKTGLIGFLLGPGLSIGRLATERLG